MMERKKIEEDLKLKSLIGQSKLKADANLSYKIMQQIKTESSLIRINRKEQKINSQIRNIFFIAGATYAIILLLAIITYMNDGIMALTSTSFLLSIFFVSVIACAYGVLTFFDEKLRGNMKERQKNRV